MRWTRSPRHCRAEADHWQLDPKKAGKYSEEVVAEHRILGEGGCDKDHHRGMREAAKGTQNEKTRFAERRPSRALEKFSR